MIKKLLIKKKTARIVFYIKTLNVKVMKNNSKCISSLITVQIMQSPNTTIKMDGEMQPGTQNLYVTLML